MDKEKIDIVIADDHPLLLKGMYEELTESQYHVIGQAVDGFEALQLVIDLKPQIAILDIDMPLLSGLEVVKMAKEKKSETKFIVLSFHKENEYIVQSKTLQIDGYMLKENSFKELELCIGVVLAGKQYFSSSFNDDKLASTSKIIQMLKNLTASEIAILKLVAKPLSNQEIGKMFSVSERTIEKHRSNIINKLKLPKENNALTNWALVNKETIQMF